MAEAFLSNNELPISSGLQINLVTSHRVYESGGYELKIENLVTIGTGNDMLHSYYATPLMWIMIHSLSMEADNFGYSSIAVELVNKGTYSDTLFRFEYSHTSITGSGKQFNLIPEQLPALTLSGPIIILGYLNCITRNATFKSIEYSLYQLITS